MSDDNKRIVKCPVCLVGQLSITQPSQNEYTIDQVDGTWVKTSSWDDDCEPTCVKCLDCGAVWASNIEDDRDGLLKLGTAYGHSHGKHVEPGINEIVQWDASYGKDTVRADARKEESNA